MSKRKRKPDFKTNYPGVFYREVPRVGGKAGELEKSFLVTFKRHGEKISESVGKQYRDRMTPAKAARIRADLIEGRRLLQREIAAQKAETIWTVANLWAKYRTDKKSDLKGWPEYSCLYHKWLESDFAHKLPTDIVPLDCQRLAKKMEKKGLSPQRIKHALSLLRRVINYGKKLQIAPGLNFEIEMPKFNNEVTEDLTPDQLNSLLVAIEENEHPYGGSVMKMALYAGLRRGEILKLRWKDVDFDNKWINLIDAKSGRDEKVPLNPMAESVLDDLFEKYGKVDHHIFPGRNGLRKHIDKPVRAIRDAAGLPKSFRPLHGLRHYFLSEAAENGATPFEIAALGTHKDVKTSQRYIHVRDERLLAASQGVAEKIGMRIKK